MFGLSRMDSKKSSCERRGMQYTYDTSYTSSWQACACFDETGGEPRALFAKTVPVEEVTKLWGQEIHLRRDQR